MQAQSGRRRLATVAFVALVVGALVALGYVAAGTGVVDAAGRSMPWASHEAACETTQVSVAAAPQVSDVVRRAVAPLNGRTLDDGSCLQVAVDAQPPVSALQGTNALSSTQLPQLWVPDSSLWATVATTWPSQQVGSIGTSPVVLATTSTAAARLGWPGGGVSWRDGLDTARHAVLAPNVANSASGLLGLLAFAQTLGPGGETEQRVAAVVLAASRAGTTDVPSGLGAVRTAKPRAPAVLLTDAQTVTQANRDEPGRPLVAVRPEGLPAVLDYPVLRVSRSDEDPVVQGATDLVVRALASDTTRTIAAAAGFGPPAPDVTPKTEAGRAALAKAAKARADFVALIRTVAVPSRLLVVVDVSASMAQPVRPGLSRARLAATAAIRAGDLLPDRSAIGLWKFAGRQKGGKPYSRVLDIAPLSVVSTTNGVERTQRDKVNAGLAALPKQLTSGGTALYDTALAALRETRANYDPQANNAVVLFTDGTDDYKGGMSLARFRRMAAADAAAHPDQPVLLIAIGIGPSADVTALRAMTAAAGGRAYRANSVTELQTVLFDAVAHRPVPARSPTALATGG